MTIRLRLIYCESIFTVKGGLSLKRILRYVLLCTMLAGCDHQEMNLQAHHLDAKRQGFDQEEIENLIREPENANKVNRQLKNKEAAAFFRLGMTKEEIRHLDREEMDFFRARSAANQWHELDEQTVKEIFKKQADHQMIRCHIEKQKLCTASTIYTDTKKEHHGIDHIRFLVKSRRASICRRLVV